MRPLDRILQRWRVAKVRPYIPAGARVLDVGCADGVLFRLLHGHIGGGVGIDPRLERSVETGPVRLVPGRFPEALPEVGRFDVITMLAALEHVPEAELAVVAACCADALKPGGRLLVTVPSRRADPILRALQGLGLIEGMSLDEHRGFDPRRTPAIFGVAGLGLIRAERFQWGFNNLFVFEKRGA